MNPIRVTFNAALDNPNDPSELTMVADVVGVGKTHRLASGQIVTWTASLLRDKAHTFVGMPVNIDLDEDGEPTGHSRRVVGAITHSFFDERKQVVTVHAAIWPHYAPSTVARIKELSADGRIQVSMEFIPQGEMIANEDGSETPTDGEFSGLGIVRVGADPKNKVILVAALAEDEAEAARKPMKIEEIISAVRDHFQLPEPKTPNQERDEHNEELAAAHEGSFEWVSRRLAEHLASQRSADDYTYSYVVATYPKYAIYQEGESYYQINYARKGREVTFEEPVEVDPTYKPVEASAATDEDADLSQDKEPTLATEISEEQKASLRAELLAEMKPQLDELEAVKAENTTLKAEKAAAEEAAAKKELVATRMAELEDILPAEGDSKERREALCAALEDEAFAAYKGELADAAEVKGGMKSDAERHGASAEDDTDDPVEAEARKIAAEIRAEREAAATSKEG